MTFVIDAFSALQTSLSNPTAKWLARSDDNRLEPECWPAITPRFRIGPGARIFAVGSCFARNIERYLAKAGFELPTLGGAPLVEASHLNKYTPHSIAQEFRWARDILDRDDRLRPADLEPLFYRRSDGKVIDLHLLPFDPVDADTAFRRREVIYSIYRQAFSSDYIVITLGLIESWLDRETGLHVLQMPQFLRTKQALARFEFRKLSYEESFAAVQETLDLLNSRGAPKKYLLTTSPVPLARTFTDSDVIVANGYSKAVLRAVAGAVADRNAHVDYFPSFESVLLTKDRNVWENDLVHVSSAFVDRIMARVVQAYAPEVDTARLAREDRVKQFQQAALARDFAAAQPLYAELSGESGFAGDAEFEVAAAVMNAEIGRLDLARAHAGRAKGPFSHPTQMVGLMVAHCILGENEKVETLLRDLVDQTRPFPHWVGVVANQLDEAGCSGAAIRIVEIAQEAGLANVFALLGLARRRAARGQPEAAISALRAAVEADSHDAQAHFLLGRALLEAGRPEEAARSIATALDLEPQARGRRFFLATALEHSRRFDDAERILRDLLAENAADEMAVKALSGFLQRRGRDPAG